ncbi:hypothetical protein AB0B13_28740 [Streptomyces sp. NPDC042898]|uniref:hypothetical protein n=1 Tax=Streptomyces sp. NPDC042898 TaxID=3154334 RepID=UPI00340D8A92
MRGDRESFSLGAALARQYPRVSVQPEEPYIDDGQVLTSGGVAAGLDLSLHLIRRDQGARLANQQARLLVTAPHRIGGQAQFADLPPTADAPDGLAPVYEWALDHLHLTFGPGVPSPSRTRLSRPRARMAGGEDELSARSPRPVMGPQESSTAATASISTSWSL